MLFLSLERVNLLSQVVVATFALRVAFLLYSSRRLHGYVDFSTHGGLEAPCFSKLATMTESSCS